MLLAAAILLILVGNLLQAHAVTYHLRVPRPSLVRTWDLYRNACYYTPPGQRLLRLATRRFYPAALTLAIVQIARELL